MRRMVGDLALSLAEAMVVPAEAAPSLSDRGVAMSGRCRERTRTAIKIEVWIRS